LIPIFGSVLLIPGLALLFSLMNAAKADYLTTGDKKLLTLKKYRRAKIVTLTDFLKIL